MEDVLKTSFDKLIQINTGDKKSPCTDFRVFTYDVEINGAPVSEYADVMLIPVIKSIVEQTQLLLFINNKERIERIARLLKKEGINYMTISSDKKQSSTYRKIVEESVIADDVQVVIATTVLADGVSINNGVKWSCLVVADTESPLFNPSTIKQISNRFRNQYTYFGIYMRTPNPDYSETRRFNMESDYKYRENVVSDHVDYLNNEYPDELLQDFIPSNVENSNGIFYKSTEDEAIIEYNPLFVRHQCVRRKERYYRAYRNAFTKEVGRLLGHKLTGVFNVNDEVRLNNSDLSGLLADVVAEKEEKKLEADELRANFTTYFDESIYLAMIYRDEHGTLDYFKKHVHPDQYSATLKNSRITDYETCKMLGEKVTRRADINRYVNDIQALTDIASFSYVEKVTLTKRVFNALMKIEGKTYLSSDFKRITEEYLPKKLKVSKGDVKEGLKLFHKFSTKESGEACATIRPLSMWLLTSQVKYDVEPEVIKESILKQILTKSKQKQKVLHQAVKQMYDVDPGKNNAIEPAKTGTFQLDLS